MEKDKFKQSCTFRPKINEISHLISNSRSNSSDRAHLNPYQKLHNEAF